jgi:hypothetical protein
MLQKIELIKKEYILIIGEYDRRTTGSLSHPLLSYHCECLQLLYFVSLGAFLALNDLEAYLVTLIDCDAGLQAGYVYKIVLTIVACYESKALDSVEKLNCSVYHF